METESYVLRNFAERLVIFVDWHNLEGALRNESVQTDILDLMDYLAERRWLLETFVYVGFNPANGSEDENLHRFLKMNGFVVRTKPAKTRADGSLKCDFDIELAIDVIEYVSKVKPDIVLLVTGDGDFAPLATWLRERGMRVEIASTPISISQDLREAANGYIDLCEAVDEIHRVGEQTPDRRKEVTQNESSDDQRSAGPGPGYIV
jgi:uncharacterized LabA/DUF88 family protein